MKRSVEVPKKCECATRPVVVKFVHSERFRARISKAIEPRGACEDLARRSGFSSSGIKGWIKGKNSPSLGNLEILAAAMGISLIELIE